MKTKWVGHYTGIDVLDLQHWKVLHPYFQRDRETKKLQFARVCFSLPWARHWATVWIFIGRQNYASNYVTGGYQIFTNLFHFGIGHKRRSILPREAFKIDYSGSRVDPYYHISYIFFNCITFGFDTPKWFRNWRRVQDMKRWEQMPDPFGEDYDDDGTMTNPEQER